MKAIENVTENVIKMLLTSMALVTIFFLLFALLSKDDGNEANIGDFSDYEFNEGWELEQRGGIRSIDLPTNIDAIDGETVVLRNTLPENITDGMSMTCRSTMEDIAIYIDGNIRELYSSGKIGTGSYYLPSAYIVTELSKEDAGKPIVIFVEIKSRAILNGIRLGYGANSWFGIISNNIAITFLALMVLVLGVSMVIVVMFLRRSFSLGGTAASLGFLMADMGIYVISESWIRQLIFQRPSLSNYFSYYTLEMMAVFAAIYADEVQHRRYHVRYLIAEVLACMQLLVNVVFNITGIAEYHSTLILSHLWIVVTIILIFTNIIQDVITGYVKKYYVITAGLVIFVLMGIAELIMFYIDDSHVFGVSACCGLVVLMACTIMQIIIDERKTAIIREKSHTATLVSTIETIASSIDAKDEYTGGHSERVGRYASILASEMAEEYGFSEEDILRIHYIGLLHDIGKIGVDDSVLNKAGKLTDEEFSLMKKHVDIGYELMGSMGEEVDGLSDGIRHHHERFDGRGYPDGLSGEDIPLVARILCLADCYDAMTSNRVYRKRLSEEEVTAELIRCAGSQFDPQLTEIFVGLIEKGSLQPDTIDGMELSADGTIPKSSLLENRLQQDLLAGVRFENPGHVRMICYITKLLEKKNHNVRVYFANPVDKTTLGRRDINIEYTKEKNVVALIDKKAEGVEAFEKAVVSSGAGYILEELTTD